MLLLLSFFACSDAESVSSSPGGRPPAVVEVEPVAAGSLDDRWPILGEVVALERAELASGASGAVQRVSVREGDPVQKGALLVEVDPALAIAELRAAEAERDRITAELTQAKQTLARVSRVADGVMAADEVERTRTQLTSLEAQQARAEAQVQLASARLGRHRVRAPFSGAVAKRHVDPGDWVDPGVGVLDLVRTDPVEVRVEAPLELASRVEVGATVQLGEVEGQVIGVVPALDPVSRTATLRIRPVAELPMAVPGRAIQVTFQVQMQGGLLVPRDALVSGPTDQRVFEVVEGVARAVTVEVIAKSADQALVRSEELEEGDLLVVRGNERLRPDQAVQVQ